MGMKDEARLIERVMCDVVCGFCLYIWKDVPKHGVLVSLSERCLRNLRVAGSLRDILGSCISSLGPPKQNYSVIAWHIKIPLSPWVLHLNL